MIRIAIVIVISAVLGVAVYMLTNSGQHQAPPFPGVSYNGKPYACGQVAYGSAGLDFYRCVPAG